eukprot:scaffold98188_cov58-Phaeocystis_antarctica.AAC.3
MRFSSVVCPVQVSFRDTSRTLVVGMLGLVVASTGLQLPTANQAPSTRRALLSSTAAVAALALPAASFAAVKPCPGGANNCFSTAGPDKAKVTQWVWPSGMSRADATASLKSVLVAYPQAGQDGVDGGGWTLTTDTLVDNSFAAFEFKSAGTGNFAKFFNGGKPFIDDLEVSVEDTYVRRAPLEYPAGILTAARPSVHCVTLRPLCAAPVRAGRRALVVARGRLRLRRECEADQLHCQGAAREGLDGGRRRGKVSS